MRGLMQVRASHKRFSNSRLVFEVLGIPQACFPSLEYRVLLNYPQPVHFTLQRDLPDLIWSSTEISMIEI
jgi:hypothetical protein